MQAAEELLVEPVLAVLAREVVARADASFSSTSDSSSGDEDVRRAEVAVVLRDLVLEDGVIAKRVPRQLAGETVILVQVVRACA